MRERQRIGLFAGRISADALSAHKGPFRPIADPGVSEMYHDLFRTWIGNGDRLKLNLAWSHGDSSLSLHKYIPL
jgi:hypothetical protein